MGAIAETSLVMQCEVPRVLDACPLVHKWLTVDGGTKATKDKQTPGIDRLRRPAAEQGPGVFPKQHAHPVTTSPGTGVGARLGVGVLDGHNSGVWALLEKLFEAL